MNKLLKTGGTANKAKPTADLMCKLKYMVELSICHVDNDGQRSIIKSIKKVFKAPKALDARNKAFALDDRLSKDSRIDGKLCDGHLDSPLEAKVKNYRDINMLTLNIHCLASDGDFLTISEGEFNAPSCDDLNQLACEYGWYLENGYDTGGDPQLVEDEDGYQYKIINLANSEASDMFYCIGKSGSLEEILKNGIKADANGNIFLFTRKEVADNLVLNQYHHGGKYALIEVSPRGITGVIKPYITGQLEAFFERIVKQDRIEPQYVKKVEEFDSRLNRHYHDYDAMDRKLHPKKYAAIDDSSEPEIPFNYLVKIVWDQFVEYVETINGNILFSGFTSNNADVLFSRFLAVTKSVVLENDPRIIRDGKTYIQVYLCDAKTWKQYLISDSRGYNKIILKNLKKERLLLSHYIQGEQDLMALQDNEGKVHRCIMSRWTIADLDPSFLEPIPQDVICVDPTNPAKMARRVDDQAQDGMVGVYRTYTPYEYGLF